MQLVDKTPILNKRRPIADKDIVNLHNIHRKKGVYVTEEDLKNVLRRYNLRDGLITLGKKSIGIFNSKDKNKIGRAVYLDPDTGGYISQFALAYLANILLISGANDYKSKYISQKDNLLTLCNTYSNCLIDPALTSAYKLNDQDTLLSFMIRIDFEQIEYQFDPLYMMARTLVIFNELLSVINPERFEPLSDIFQRETGLNIYDYLMLCFLIYAGSLNTATFDTNKLTNADIPNLKDLLAEEKIVKFLKILKADYKSFREEDSLANEKLDPLFTKTRFNPLLVYPVIETDVKHYGDQYVIPNILAYIKKAYGGLYWWFHRYFEDQGRQQDFRNYFGYVFQEYVGRILKGIYGLENVHGEINYGNGLKFIDWWIEKDNKIYLFQSKANQFALLSKQTGDKEIIFKNEIKKITDAIEQVYKRIQDIPKYVELKIFKDKELLPFIVFLDIPFITDHLFEPWIKEGLKEIEQEKGIIGLKDFKIFLMNIEDLEYYDEAANFIGLEEVFRKIKIDIGEDFLSIVAKAKGGKLRNRYLDKVYRDFWEMCNIFIEEKAGSGLNIKDEI